MPQRIRDVRPVASAGTAAQRSQGSARRLLTLPVAANDRRTEHAEGVLVRENDAQPVVLPIRARRVRLGPGRDVAERLGSKPARPALGDRHLLGREFDAEIAPFALALPYSLN